MEQRIVAMEATHGLAELRHRTAEEMVRVI
jgi:hypothetical protein